MFLPLSMAKLETVLTSASLLYSGQMPCVVNRETSVVPVVFLGLATLMLVLSCVSAPYIDSVRLFRLVANVNGAKRYVDFGVFGYCVLPIEGVTGFDSSVREGCSKAKLGYTIDAVITGALRTSEDLQTALTRTLSSSLVLYPIATIFTFPGFLIACAIWIANRHCSLASSFSVASSSVILAFSGVSTLVASLTLAVMISVVARVNSKVAQIHKAQGNLSLAWDNVIWLTVLVFLAHVYNLIFVFSMRKQIKREIVEEGVGNRRRKNQRKRRKDRNAPAVRAERTPEPPEPWQQV